MYPQFSSTALFNKLITSDFLILRIILRKSTFLTAILAISLILTLKILKSLQLLQTESCNLNPKLKKNTSGT